MEEMLTPVSARDLGFMFWRRRWSMFLIVAAAMAGGVFYLWFVRDDLYAVSARVMVKIGREQAPPPTVMGMSPLVVGYRTSEVNTEMEVFQSTQVLQKTIDDLGLDKPGPEPPEPQQPIARLKYHLSKVVRGIKAWQEETLIALGLRERLTPREKVLNTLQKGLAVKAAKDSNIFVATLATPYRKGSGNVLNGLLDRYLVFRQGLYQGGEFGFFSNVAEDAGKTLSAAESRLQEFENRRNISLLGKQEETLIEQVSRQQALVKDAQIARDEVFYKVHQLEQELKKAEPNFGSVGEFSHESFQQNVLNQLAELQREREKLRLTELDTGDKIQNNREQFRTLAGMLAANLRSVLAERDALLAANRGALERLENDLRARHGATQEWAALRRKVSDDEATYMAYRRKLSEAKAAADMQQQQISNVAVVERPIDPIQPIGLRKTTLLGIVFLMAILAALAWVAIAEYFDQRVYSVQDLEERLGAPVLAEMPRGGRS